MSDGWVMLHRKIIDWAWFRSPETLQVFVYLLCGASYTDCQRDGVDLKRGQIKTKLPEIVRETGLSEKQIRTILNRLKSAGTIDNVSNNQYRIITICNYDTYQYSEIEPQAPEIPTEGRPGAGRGQAEGRPGAGRGQAEGRPAAGLLIGIKKEIKKKDIGGVLDTLLSRSEIFKTEVFSFSGQYPSDTIAEFFDYWSEPNRTQTKMKFELQKTWNTARRLARWAAMNKKFNNTPNESQPTVYYSPVGRS